MMADDLNKQVVNKIQSHHQTVVTTHTCRSYAGLVAGLMQAYSPHQLIPGSNLCKLLIQLPHTLIMEYFPYGTYS